MLKLLDSFMNQDTKILLHALDLEHITSFSMPVLRSLWETLKKRFRPDF